MAFFSRISFSLTIRGFHLFLVHYRQMPVPIQSYMFDSENSFQNLDHIMPAQNIMLLIWQLQNPTRLTEWNADHSLQYLQECPPPTAPQLPKGTDTEHFTLCTHISLPTRIHSALPLQWSSDQCNYSWPLQQNILDLHPPSTHLQLKRGHYRWLLVTDPTCCSKPDRYGFISFWK